MRLLHSLISIFCLLSLSGCATWAPGGSAFKHRDGYTLTVPPGWIFHPAMGNELLATREGLLLQSFKVVSLKLPRTLPASKIELTRALTLYEVAEGFVAEGNADTSLSAFTVTAQTQVMIGTKPGIRYDYRHTTTDGLQLSARRWVVPRGDTLWMATYAAPTRHYYEHDLASVTSAVERVVFDNSAGR
jgi:hypothetical protein